MVALTASHSAYEIHKDGCRHLNMRSKYPYGFDPIEAETPSEAVARFEAASEDCLARLAPCVKGG